MSMLTDPSMKEIVDDFCVESNALLGELDDVLDELDENPENPDQLEKFGQIIDRIMGAAKSIGADEISTFCELGKVIGYKSSQASGAKLLNIVVAVLFDTNDLLKKMLASLQKGNEGNLADLNTKTFASRLRWLSEKFKDIDRSSVDIGSTGSDQSLNQSSIDDLMSSLGL